MISLSKLLVPTDFSDAALEATRYGLEFARRFQAQLHLLHVIEDPLVYVAMFESYRLPSKAEFEAYAQQRLDAWILPEDAAGCDIVRCWAHGSPFVEIVRYARVQEIDLIVLGTHGRSIAAHLLIGSVAERVVRKASCPVLTVRPTGHQFVHPGDAAAGSPAQA